MTIYRLFERWILPRLALFATPVSAFGAFTQAAVSQLLSQAQLIWNTTALLNATLPANFLSGAGEVYLTATANGANALTTRTAAQIIADLAATLGFPPPTGFSWYFQLANQGNNTVTLTAGAGVTITGTATVGTGVWRGWMVTVTGSGTVTFQNLGAGDAT